MNSSRASSSLALAACAASFVVALAACSSDADTSTAASSSASTPAGTEYFPTDVATPATAAPSSECPSVAPANGGTPEWTLPGTTGSVAVTGSTDTTAPYVNVTAPFSVTETQVHTLKPGDGPIVSDTATVSVCYLGVNGRDGSVFDSSYERGAPIEFSLDGVVPGFQKAIAGQKIGSTVAVAVTSADGYPAGQPSAGIEPGDTLVFAIKILNATS